MKPALVVFLLLMSIGGGLGLVILQDPGYVSIRYNEILIESSLWVFLATMMLAVLALLTLISLLKWFFSLPKAYDAWKDRKQEKSLFYKAELGMLAMIESRWLEAKKLLSEAADSSDNPLIFLLTAARAAHNLGTLDDREKLLRRISTISKETEQAVAFMRVEFYMDEGRYREAARILSDLRLKTTISEFWLKKLLECYRALGEERKIESLLPELEKRGVLN